MFLQDKVVVYYVHRLYGSVDDTPYSILGLAVVKVDNLFPNKTQLFAALINSVSTIEFGIFYNWQFNIRIFSLPLSKMGGKVSFVLPPPPTHTDNLKSRTNK